MGTNFLSINFIICIMEQLVCRFCTVEMKAAVILVGAMIVVCAMLQDLCFGVSSSPVPTMEGESQTQDVHWIK